VGGEEQSFDIPLAPGVQIKVRHARDLVRGMDWAAVLTVKVDGRFLPVCVYDNAHGYPERHRYRHGVKLAPEALAPRRSARLDLPAAVSEIKANWEGMVDRWEQ
jgi:hypothetical protein